MLVEAFPTSLQKCQACNNERQDSSKSISSVTRTCIHAFFFKMVQSSEFISLQDFIIIAIFMKVFSQFVTTRLQFLLCIIMGVLHWMSVALWI